MLTFASVLILVLGLPLLYFFEIHPANFHEHMMDLNGMLCFRTQLQQVLSEWLAE